MHSIQCYGTYVTRVWEKGIYPGVYTPGKTDIEHTRTHAEYTVTEKPDPKGYCPNIVLKVFTVLNRYINEAASSRITKAGCGIT